MKKAKRRNTAPSGNLKISNFFTKINSSTDNKKTTTGNNSDHNKSILENITNIPQSSNSPDGSKKRKLDEKFASSSNNLPSKKVCDNSISSKSSKPAQIIYVTTPEKVLTTETVEELACENMKSPIPSSEKWIVTEANTINNLSGDVPRTPSKTIKTPVKQKITPDTTNNTPNKNRRTPAKLKLFEKSPKKLDEYNVQILNNFIKITPSKSNKIVNNTPTSVEKTEKKQSSILKYVSPSKRTLQVQNENESTPVKIPIAQQSPQVHNGSKVKTKLDFSGCKPTKSPQKTVETLVNKSSLAKDEHQEYLFNDCWVEDFNKIESFEFKLDLSKSQHCKIVTIINKSPIKVVIQVKSTKSDDQAICNLEGFWVNSELKVGDIIHLRASQITKNEWSINNEKGLLVFEPDLLVSSTSVVNSLFCKRRTVLSERFHGFEPGNRHMIIGILVHTLLQTVLKDKLTDSSQIEKVLTNLLKLPSTIKRLYECGLTVNDIKTDLQLFIPRIIEFISQYVKGKTKNFEKNNWKGQIEKIIDIEENIWLPELGIKGKVDVSVQSGFHTMPLELKTGRAIVSLEHRGQVILYLMMMNKLGYKVSSGLLLYLREGVLKEIPMSHKEERDIMILRNDLAYYLSKTPTVVEKKEHSLKFLPPQLPEPIIHHSACSNCPYNVICTTYLKSDNYDLSSNKYLQKVQEEVSSHLSQEHINYFIHWSTLLAIEGKAKTGHKELQEIYTMPPKVREINGKCIINVKVVHTEAEYNGIYKQIFKKIDENSHGSNFLASEIAEGNYVVVSTDKRPAIAAGFVTYIDSNSISIALDRDLVKKYPNCIFHLDTYSSSSIQQYNMISLALLLENTKRAQELRRIVIEKTPPTFLKKLPTPVADKAKPILRRLNKIQQRAVLKALTAKEYLLIKGMPGTGKTATIVALIQLLVKLDKTILITSHTHSAVDNVCIQLQKFGVEVLRLGAESRINEALKARTEHNLTKHCTSPEELEEIYNNANVLAVTCLGSGHPLLSKRIVDFCIVDESTQVMQTSVIRSIYSAKTFILIGDPDQLPPVIKNKDAINAGISESLFERLDSPNARVTLTYNYRMNKTITAIANALTYRGELLIGSEQVANACLQITKTEELDASSWIGRALDTSLEASFQVIDTGAVWNFPQQQVPWFNKASNLHNDGYINIYEAAVIGILVKTLLKVGVSENDIGVMAMYRAQVALISALLSNTKIAVSTVDQFQGQDKNVILYSCTKSQDMSKSKGDRKYEILEDKRRLTVAITRAKNKLILIGDLGTIETYSTFSQLLNALDRSRFMKLNEFPDFQWDSVLDLSEFR